MKTAVRIQEREDGQRGYGFMSIQILVPSSPKSEVMEPIGEITFQRNLNEDEGMKIWYGMRFNVETDKVSDLEKMTKIARVVFENSDYYTQPPSSILKIIGAVEYKLFKFEFIPVAKEGENFYDVLSSSGSLHSRIVAPSEKKALSILKRKKLEGATVKLNAVIKF